ncbi:MAG: hypothetical protein CL867_11410 [Cytophagaceae bacterium]|nr:hypothetical protein [Cytophagaceae bacterium]|tara:strand:+ start:329 stop:634 length:306 start_codon:yes stop_codon:yes gene_type:complete
MSKVYVVQEVSGKNLLPAASYGELEFLVPPLTNLMFETEATVSKIRTALRGFTEDDYLLLVGDPVCIGIATHYAAEECEEVNFLKWDNREYKYYPVTVDFK